MFTYSVHTVAVEHPKPSEPARRKIQFYQIDGRLIERTPVSESETGIAYFTAISSSDVTPEFASLIYGLKDEYAWVLAELAKS